MCTFNGEYFLKEQLESILAQTIRPDELIVVDDCSQDSTLDILFSFKNAADFPVRIIVNKKNIGINKNFEHAIACCEGELIALSDQDDIWMPSKIESIINSFQQHPDCGYVFSNASLVNENGSYLGNDLWSSVNFNVNRYLKYTTGDQLEVMLRGGNFIYGMAMAFRSKYKNIVLPIESRLHSACTHDTWIAIILSAVGARGIPIEKSLVMYRKHAKQVTSIENKSNFYFRKNMFFQNNEKNIVLADVLMKIINRLDQVENSFDIVSVLNARKQLIDKSIHLRARALISSGKFFKRLYIIYGEASSGRYKKYSGSYKSVLKDIVAGLCAINITTPTQR